MIKKHTITLLNSIVHVLSDVPLHIVDVKHHLDPSFC